MAETLWEYQIGVPHEFTNVQTIRCSRLRMMNRTLSVTAPSCVWCRSVNMGWGVGYHHSQTTVHKWNVEMNILIITYDNALTVIYPFAGFLVWVTRTRTDGTTGSQFWTLPLEEDWENWEHSRENQWCWIVCKIYRHSSQLVSILFLNCFFFPFLFLGDDQYFIQDILPEKSRSCFLPSQ